MKVLDDYTNYDVGQPFATVLFPKGSISHCPNGIVVSLQSGIRYTCSYNRLISALKINSVNPDDVEVRTNLNDIFDKMTSTIKSYQKQVEKLNEQLNQ